MPLTIKPTAKLPPSIMEMHDVNDQLIYEAGKDEQNPLDYLLRHPLQYTSSDSTEILLRHIVTNVNAMVLERIVTRDMR